MMVKKPIKLYGRWKRDKNGNQMCPYPSKACLKNYYEGICCQICDKFTSCPDACQNKPYKCGKLDDYK